MRVVLVSFIVCFCWSLGFGQQDPLFSQYTSNKLAFNPAYAGSHKTISFTALYRQQWSGLEGAPRTTSFNVHAPLKNKRVALGVQVIDDRLGISSTSGLYFNYAYHLPTAQGRLSLGLDAGALLYALNVNDAFIRDHGDQLLQEGSYSKWLPNFGVGVYYYDSRFYAGASVRNLIENRLHSLNTTSNTIDEARQYRHLFLMGGYVFHLNNSLVFRPSALIKYAENAPVQADINADFLLAQRVWVGAGYRSSSEAVASFKLVINRQLTVGYAFDYTLSRLGNYSGGSHELLLNYELNFDKKKFVTPRNPVPHYF